MGLQLSFAKGMSALSTWGLKYVFRRPAANFPGKLALYIDPRLIADLGRGLRKGSVVVSGTNGKTTVTHLVASTLEAAGMEAVWNKTGANLDSGIATALLQSGEADWGVFECDELWVAQVLPRLESDYLVLLDLFPDQLDRFGESSVIQDSIEAALKAAPSTVFVFNADDPMCAAIAAKVGNKSIGFGIAQAPDAAEGAMAESLMCQMCSSMLHYSWHQYGQLGDYDCPECGFKRPELGFSAQGIRFEAAGLSFDAVVPPNASSRIRAPYHGTYMVYNLLAAFAVCTLLGCPPPVFQEVLDAYDPQNGRLQEFCIGGNSILLNLAKNPTGFNQNLMLALQDTKPKAAAFFMNDREGDGRDTSWIWDVDFEALAGHDELQVFAGGIRKNDLQLRLKYAGVPAQLVENAQDVLSRCAGQRLEGGVFMIANYTALPPIREELSGIAGKKGRPAQADAAADAATKAAADAADGQELTGAAADAADGQAASAAEADAAGATWDGGLK